MSKETRQTTRSTPAKAPATINVTEQHQLLNELVRAKNPPQPDLVRYRNHGMALLMLDAGLRVGEVTQLLITDLLIRNEPAWAVHLTAAHTKNRTERTIPLSGRIRNSIKMMMPYCWLPFLDRPGSFAFFAHDARCPLSTRQVERIIKRAAIRSLGRAIHPHVLRHTFASKLMRVTNARIVQEMLGHRSITSTQVYTHPNGDDLVNAIRASEG